MHGLGGLDFWHYAEIPYAKWKFSFHDFLHTFFNESFLTDPTCLNVFHHFKVHIDGCMIM